MRNCRPAGSRPRISLSTKVSERRGQRFTTIPTTEGKALGVLIAKPLPLPQPAPQKRTRGRPRWGLTDRVHSARPISQPWLDVEFGLLLAGHAYARWRASQPLEGHEESYAPARARRPDQAGQRPGHEGVARFGDWSAGLRQHACRYPSPRTGCYNRPWSLLHPLRASGRARRARMGG